MARKFYLGFCVLKEKNFRNLLEMSKNDVLALLLGFCG